MPSAVVHSPCSSVCSSSGHIIGCELCYNVFPPQSVLKPPVAVNNIRRSHGLLECCGLKITDLRHAVMN